MPNYDIQHSFPLTKEQRDALAKRITYIHTRKFTTPSLFINVQFTDLANIHTYVAGTERNINRTTALVRPGPTRTGKHFIDLAREMKQAWDDIVNGGVEGKGDCEMKVVVVMDALAAGMESGFAAPLPGEDGNWFKEYRTAFEKLAVGGDQDFIDLLKEMDSREDLVARLK